MSACVEWGVPFTIRSSYGDLDLNDPANPLGFYVLVESGCAMGRDLRVVSDDIPQGDGQIHHRRFASGYQARLTIAFFEDEHKRACGAQLQAMVDELGLHLNVMLNDTGRVLWTPTADPVTGAERMLDEARVASIGRPTGGEGGYPQIDVLFDSPFPYAIDATQVQEAMVTVTPEYLSNDGNVETFPVIRVDGPASSFDLINHTTGQQLSYDSSRPGATGISGGDYIEFDFFRNSAWLNGDDDRRFAGIDVAASDFWALVPGVNYIEIVGADMTVLYNHSWA